MQDLVPIRRALLSVSDKNGVVALARSLAQRGVELVSTGGTAQALADAGLTVIPVEDLTGFAEMMDGRVKTLHPLIHGSLLARREHPGDREALQRHDIRLIDLVCVNLYPFARTVSRPDVTLAEALEQIDIGGPSMIRSSAKNHPWITVLTAPEGYGGLLAELDSNDGCTTLAFRRRQAEAAFRVTAEYDAAIAGWLGTGALPGEDDGRPLRYGENPHQRASVHADEGYEGPSVAGARILHGKPLSYNNLQDAAAALELVQDLHAVFPDRVSAAIIKHTNACGAAVADTAADAFDRAHAGDPLAAYGGVLAVSGPVDGTAAARIAEGRKFLEVIVAPGFDEDAAARLGERWKNVRLLAVAPMRPAGPDRTVRSIPGGLLVQSRDDALPAPDTWKRVAGPAPGARVLSDARFAWTVVKHLKSNAIAIAAAGRLLGAGCGCVDRVAAARQAVEKAGERAHGAVAASDAFFPFPDGPQLLIDAGVSCIVHPGGSRRDDETVEVCEKHAVTCLLTGVRHFRH